MAKNTCLWQCWHTIQSTPPNLANYSPYELAFGRKPKMLLDFETDPDIKNIRNFQSLLSTFREKVEMFTGPHTKV